MGESRFVGRKYALGKEETPQFVIIRTGISYSCTARMACARIGATTGRPHRSAYPVVAAMISKEVEHYL